MPSERSTFRKLQVVLDYAKMGRHEDARGLVDFIAGRAPTNFAYSFRDRKTDKIRKETSVHSISKAVELAIELGLLSSGSAALSRIGVAATDARRFPHIIGSKVAVILEGQGITMEVLRRTIVRDLFHADPPELPTSDALWSRFPDTGLDLAKFVCLLRLLVDSGVLQASQKRIYLP